MFPYAQPLAIAAGGQRMVSAQAKQDFQQVDLPKWLPDPVRVYLAHTEGGESIRAIARGAGRHASTVLRQVRRTETLRDDPLADAALTRLGQLWRWRAGDDPSTPTAQDTQPMSTQIPDETTFRTETLRVLKALMEPHTLLVVAEGVEDAVVVFNPGNDVPVRRAALKRDVAEALALREFIEGRAQGRIARYTITPAGRAEVGRLMAENESRRAAAAGQAEDADIIGGAELFGGGRTGRRAAARPRRPVGAESPLHVLARRKRAGGDPYLTTELIAAGLRFRESYEIARMDGWITRDWDRLIAGRLTGTGRAAPAAPTRRLEAETSLAGAIRALGPDLAETVIMSVCQDQGMEAVEAKLDFPARSGKIVLRIALRTLVRHYAETGSDGYDLIY